MLTNSADSGKREPLSDARPIQPSSQEQQPPIVYAVPVDAGIGQVLNANPAPQQAIPVQTYMIDARGPLVRPI